jgi:hypothetical protein
LKFDPTRLRRGELIVGGGAVALAAAMFLLPWYGIKSPFGLTAASLGLTTSLDGWNGLSNIRWLVLVTILVAAALVWLQATRRAPALPTTFGMIVTVLGLLTVLALIYRVLINVPGANSLVDRKVGAYVGLIGSVAVFYGGYASLRGEGLSERDARTEIETVPLTGARAPDPAPEA